MKLSHEVLVNSVPVLSKLNQLELPVKVAFILAKNIKEVDKSLESYNETRKKLLIQYAEKDENNMPKSDDAGNIIFKEGCQEKWGQDIQELLKLKTNIKIQPISTHDFFKAEISISPSELERIEFMIKE
ncbi:hypothetical protein [Turicibacter sanguinis]|uniref:hypothetical protein n=1 Tax=Turicibacter sanguinis TaxID=154288 RepID=UPI0018A981C7|nr:hypothetical protein [Turicibacter sanguinis]MDB8553883.1 hypothetical protein [Turicibacter sanguinis]